MTRPSGVTAAHARAEAAGFPLSCEDVAGAMLSALAAAVPEGGRILELGTGAGVGLAWLVHGVGVRQDVEIISVDLDPKTQAVARATSWPGCVQFELGDGAERVGALGQFDLIFADAPGGKLTNLEGTIAALRPTGLLLVDDMDLSRHEDPELRRLLSGVRGFLMTHSDLVSVELDAGSGLLLSTRRS